MTRLRRHARRIVSAVDPGKLAAVAGLFVGVACSSEEEASVGRSDPASSAANPMSASSRRSQDSRPSVVLVVLDTLRADAVSIYGEVEGTTPHLDQLAREGLRYERAYAPAPWTISSHASLFSGLRVDEHGVGLAGVSVVPDGLQMLAEDFQAAGFATASFAENALIDSEFGFEQGFDRFESPDLADGMERVLRGDAVSEFRLLDRVRAWDAERDKDTPYFLFVNLFDAHDPYEIRETNPWVPDAVPRWELDYIVSTYLIPQALCDALPKKEHLAALRGLYLGDVATADAKLGALLRMLEETDPGTPRIVVATSDHGEHLGENGLMGHQFSVRHSALHIPLIVTGLPQRPPTVITKPVELRSVYSSLRCWALGDACAGSLPVVDSGDALETDLEASNPIISIYSDSVARMPDSVLRRFEMTREQERAFPSVARAKCEPEDRVFGEMVSMIRYPFKMTWFSQNEMVLHDLRWDRAERSDQMPHEPVRSLRLRTELERFVLDHVSERRHSDAPELSDEAARTLESLGYIH